MDISNIDISIVIPVFNEEENLQSLFSRLYPVMQNLGKKFEIIFVDDGSMDNSLQVLKDIIDSYDNLSIIQFNKNYGQHAAVFAGLEKSKGKYVVTLDADLQNPPEDIPKLISKLDEGYDVVGGWREERKDSFLRTIPSYIVNKITSKVIGINLKDYGCMLRAYRREIVDNICQCREISSFIPALANIYTSSVAEIKVGHNERIKGKSKYNLFKLIRLNFDLITGFSTLPMQVVNLMGIGISFVGIALAIYLYIRSVLVGSLISPVYTMFSILFFFIGLQVFAIGLVGEYIVRIYNEVRDRPRYTIKKFFAKN